jgi:hypothetical protein
MFAAVLSRRVACSPQLLHLYSKIFVQLYHIVLVLDRAQCIHHLPEHGAAVIWADVGIDQPYAMLGYVLALAICDNHIAGVEQAVC